MLAYRNEEASLSDLCRRFGVSRKTGRKWVGRYRELGPEGVRDRSRAPLRHPNATPPDVVAAMIEKKLKYPTWGAGKVVAWLVDNRPEVATPAAGTAGDILKRHGLVRRPL
ncbi:MAG: helix-turn-helix domain-containing protein [Dehalococcoidia bacterium]